MSSGTFGYPLCFAVFFAAIGLIIRSTSEVPVASFAEKAAYHEIATLYEQKGSADLREKCEQFMRRYPDSKGYEAVATLSGELIVKTGNWKEIGSYHRGLANKFPESKNSDRFLLFQGLAFFQDANFKESTPIFTRILKDFPNNQIAETAQYYLAMSHFLSNDYKEALKGIKEYLARFPNGRYSGDLQYRFAFIDFNDQDVDQSDKIIRDLTTFLNEHPNDAAAGSIYCLLADTYKKKTSAKADEPARFEQLAIDAYQKAAWSASPPDVIEYALDSATAMLQARKDWAGIAKLHVDFLNMELMKLEAMIEMGQLEAAEKLGIQIVGDKRFRWEVAGKARLLLSRIYLKLSENADEVDAKLEFQRKSHDALRSMRP
jgi:outer membrane protein assembly factor BamD (BamD/ComL family)